MSGNTATLRPVLSVEEVAEMLGVSVRSIWNWSHEGRLPKPFHIGKLARWRREELNQWLNGQQTGSENGSNSNQEGGR